VANDIFWETEVEIVDSQIHVWSEPHGAETRPSFTYTDLIPIMDDAGVSRAVLVPPSWTVEGNELGLAAARALPGRFGCMGHIALEKLQSRGALTQFKAAQGMLGARLALRREPNATWLIDGTADWFWPEADAAGLTVMVYAPGKLDVIVEKVKDLRNIRIIVDHMALVPSARGQQRENELAGTERVARLPNFAVKVSALPLYSDEAYPHRDVEQIVKRVVNAFGAERSFWGSDFTRLKCTYPQAVQMMTDGMPFLNSRQKELVLGRGILDWLNWK
jgi:predicted TIM-barrel fold metal-dependent hydrolase